MARWCLILALVATLSLHLAEAKAQCPVDELTPTEFATERRIWTFTNNFEVHFYKEHEDCSWWPWALYWPWNAWSKCDDDVDKKGEEVKDSDAEIILKHEDDESKEWDQRIKNNEFHELAKDDLSEEADKNDAEEESEESDEDLVEDEDRDELKDKSYKPYMYSTFWNTFNIMGSQLELYTSKHKFWGTMTTDWGGETVVKDCNGELQAKLIDGFVYDYKHVKVAQYHVDDSWQATNMVVYDLASPPTALYRTWMPKLVHFPLFSWYPGLGGIQWVTTQLGSEYGALQKAQDVEETAGVGSEDDIAEETGVTNIATDPKVVLLLSTLVMGDSRISPLMMWIWTGVLIFCCCCGCCCHCFCFYDFSEGGGGCCGCCCAPGKSVSRTEEHDSLLQTKHVETHAPPAAPTKPAGFLNCCSRRQVVPTGAH